VITNKTRKATKGNAKKGKETIRKREKEMVFVIQGFLFCLKSKCMDHRPQDGALDRVSEIWHFCKKTWYFHFSKKKLHYQLHSIFIMETPPKISNLKCGLDKLLTVNQCRNVNINAKVTCVTCDTSIWFIAPGRIVICTCS